MQNEGKKVYATPKVVSYGVLTDLTRCFGAATSHDTTIFPDGSVSETFIGPDSQICDLRVRG